MPDDSNYFWHEVIAALQIATPVLELWHNHGLCDLGVIQPVDGDAFGRAARHYRALDVAIMGVAVAYCRRGFTIEQGFQLAQSEEIAAAIAARVSWTIDDDAVHVASGGPGGSVVFNVSAEVRTVLERLAEQRRLSIINQQKAAHRPVISTYRIGRANLRDH